MRPRRPRPTALAERLTTLANTAPWRTSSVAIGAGTVAWAESQRVARGEVSRATFQTRIRVVALRSRGR